MAEEEYVLSKLLRLFLKKDLRKSVFAKEGTRMEANIYKNKKPVIFFLIPAFLFMVIFLYYPFFENILNSFQSITSLGAKAKGFNTPWYENYINMFRDENMHIALKNTAIMILATVVFQVGISLILALLVDNIKKGAGFFRVVYFFPIVISATALGLLFRLIFLYDKGMVNQFLEICGKTELVDWKDEAHAIFTMMVPVIWQYIGFYFVILITGLNGIPQDIYEAAEIDGASRFQRVIMISIPLIRGTISTCVVLAVTGALKVFDLPWIMFPKGLPLGKTWLTGTYMYYETFNVQNVDYGSAIAVAIVVLGVILSAVVNKVFKQTDEY